MDVYTIQMAKHRLLKDTGIELLDITVKSGVLIFAPSWEILNAYRSAGSSDSAWVVYKKDFYNKMRNSYKQNKTIWHRWIQNDKPIALACYCGAGKNCHRHLILDIWLKIAEKQGFELNYKGEITSLEDLTK